MMSIRRYRILDGLDPKPVQRRIYELQDGKLAASRGMYDRLALITQLGLMEAPMRSS